VIKAMRGPGYNFFSHQNGLKFSLKVGIFPKMNVSPKKWSSLLTGQRLIEGESWVHALCATRHW